MGKNIKNNINLVHDNLQWSYDQANSIFDNGQNNSNWYETTNHMDSQIT